jgi:hypothetical protein
MTERACVRRKQRERLRCGDGDRDCVEQRRVPAVIGNELPAAFAGVHLVHGRAVEDPRKPAQRSHERAHARHADRPVLDRRVPDARVLGESRSPGSGGTETHGAFHVLAEWPAARSDELGTVVERRPAFTTRREPTTKTARTLEDSDRDVGARKLGRAAHACDTSPNHRDPAFGHASVPVHSSRSSLPVPGV